MSVPLRQSKPCAMGDADLVLLLKQQFPHPLIEQNTADGIPSLWVDAQHVGALLHYCKHELHPGYTMLYDLTAIDERVRSRREGQPPSDFTVVYQVLSLTGNTFLRIKVALMDAQLRIDSQCDLWPNANWYERECHDMFGIDFVGHPNLYPLIIPPTWKGHPLRKEHPARATEMEPFSINDQMQDEEQEALRFVPEQWGMKREGKNLSLIHISEPTRPY